MFSIKTKKGCHKISLRLSVSCVHTFFMTYLYVIYTEFQKRVHMDMEMLTAYFVTSLNYSIIYIKNYLV